MSAISAMVEFVSRVYFPLICLHGLTGIPTQVTFLNSVVRPDPNAESDSDEADGGTEEQEGEEDEDEEE